MTVEQHLWAADDAAKTLLECFEVEAWLMAPDYAVRAAHHALLAQECLSCRGSGWGLFDDTCPGCEGRGWNPRAGALF